MNPTGTNRAAFQRVNNSTANIQNNIQQQQTQQGQQQRFGVVNKSIQPTTIQQPPRIQHGTSTAMTTYNSSNQQSPHPQQQLQLTNPQQQQMTTHQQQSGQNRSGGTQGGVNVSRDLLQQKLRNDYELKCAIVQLEEHLANAQTMVKRTEEYIKATESEARNLRHDIQRNTDQIELMKDTVAQWPVKEHSLKQRLEFYRKNSKIMIERKIAECDALRKKMEQHQNNFQRFNEWFDGPLRQRVATRAKPELNEIEQLQRKIEQLNLNDVHSDLDQQKQEITRLKRQNDDLQYQIDTMRDIIQQMRQRMQQLENYPLKLATAMSTQSTAAGRSLMNATDKQALSSLETQPFHFDSQFLSFKRPTRQIKLPDAHTVKFYTTMFNFDLLLDNFLIPHNDDDLASISENASEDKNSKHHNLMNNDDDQLRTTFTTQERNNNTGQNVVGADGGDIPLQSQQSVNAATGQAHPDGMDDSTISTSGTTIVPNDNNNNSLVPSLHRYSSQRTAVIPNQPRDDQSILGNNNDLLSQHKLNRTASISTIASEAFIQKNCDKNDPIWFWKKDLTFYLRPTIKNAFQVLRSCDVEGNNPTIPSARQSEQQAENIEMHDSDTIMEEMEDESEEGSQYTQQQPNNNIPPQTTTTGHRQTNVRIQQQQHNQQQQSVQQPQQQQPPSGQALRGILKSPPVQTRQQQQPPPQQEEEKVVEPQPTEPVVQQQEEQQPIESVPQQPQPQQQVPPQKQELQQEQPHYQEEEQQQQQSMDSQIVPSNTQMEEMQYSEEQIQQYWQDAWNQATEDCGGETAPEEAISMRFQQLLLEAGLPLPEGFGEPVDDDGVIALDGNQQGIDGQQQQPQQQNMNFGSSNNVSAGEVIDETGLFDSFSNIMNTDGDAGLSGFSWGDVPTTTAGASSAAVPSGAAAAPSRDTNPTFLFGGDSTNGAPASSSGGLFPW